MPMDAVFKALADPSRRRLLDRLNARSGQSLRELCDGLSMARQSVTKHLAVLEAAGVVTTSRRGREKLTSSTRRPSTTSPIVGWIATTARAEALADLKRGLEDRAMSETEFVYTTYIATTPERLWQALTDPAFTRRYWGAELYSDWQVGSPVLWKEGLDEEPRDLGQVVLEAEPQRRLSYTWHHPRAYHAEMLGWSAERLAEAQREPRSRATFDLEPADDAVKLTVTHDGFAPGSPMLDAVRAGWPQLLANLKTLLETGDTMHAAPVRAAAGAEEPQS